MLIDFDMDYECISLLQGVVDKIAHTKIEMETFDLKNVMHELWRAADKALREEYHKNPARFEGYHPSFTCDDLRTIWINRSTEEHDRYKLAVIKFKFPQE